MTIPLISWHVWRSGLMAGMPLVYEQPTPDQLYGLKHHVDGRRMVTYTHRYLIKHRTDHLGGWYA